MDARVDQAAEAEARPEASHLRDHRQGFHLHRHRIRQDDLDRGRSLRHPTCVALTAAASGIAEVRRTALGHWPKARPGDMEKAELLGKAKEAN